MVSKSWFFFFLVFIAEKINKKDFEVIGILKKSSNFQINSVYLIPTKELEEILEIEKEYDIIIAQVKDKDEIEEVAEKIN